MSNEDFFGLLLGFSVFIGFTLHFLWLKVDFINDYVDFLYYKDKEFEAIPLIMIVTFFLSPIFLIITVVSFISLIRNKKEFDKVHECDECGYYFRLNQVNFISISKAIINNEIYIASSYTKYTVCPKCSKISAETKHHEELKNEEINGTKKTTFFMYIKLYINIKKAYKYLKNSDKETKKENKRNMKKKEEEKKNKELYLENKKRLEIKSKVENINQKQ